jgi:hypothetical protein
VDSVFNSERVGVHLSELFDEVIAGKTMVVHVKITVIIGRAVEVTNKIKCTSLDASVYQFLVTLGEQPNPRRVRGDDEAGKPPRS